jgi:hypothetical protein
VQDVEEEGPRDAAECFPQFASGTPFQLVLPSIGIWADTSREDEEMGHRRGASPSCLP